MFIKTTARPAVVISLMLAVAFAVSLPIAAISIPATAAICVASAGHQDDASDAAGQSSDPATDADARRDDAVDAEDANEAADEAGTVSSDSMSSTTPGSGGATGDEEFKPTSEQLNTAFKSLYFTTFGLGLGVLGVLIAIAFGSPGKFEPFFGGGQLLQFVVIVMVAGNSCTLAIMGLLGASEISAIYGGIVGYVLGSKRSQKVAGGADETPPKTKTPKGASAGGPPAGGTPAGGTPAGGTPAGGTPAGGTPAGGTPAGGTPSTPASGTPAKGGASGGSPGGAPGG